MAKLTPDEVVTRLSYHYSLGTNEIDTRMTRKNGFNDIIDAYMGRLPSNWPYLSVVTDPRIRTVILEKTARLLNAKLRGRLVPREGGDIVKARINNALLDFQWDNATTGGSMIEKVAALDQTCRLFGAAFALTYWDTERSTNEMKVMDQRDIWWDGSATHPMNAEWCQIREWANVEQLEDRGYDVSKIKTAIKKGDLDSQKQDSVRVSKVKMNKSVENRVGEIDDPDDPVFEVVTEWARDYKRVFIPKISLLLEDSENPFKHGKIPVSMLRYYPLGDDIYGESEVESVLPIQRALNAFLCATIDEVNISMRPPLKIASTGVRIDTIVYGPSAKWIMQNPNLVQEMAFSGQALSNFQVVYPSLLSAFNTAMGDSSLGVSNGGTGRYDTKTATEVASLEKQQNNRDQYNQLYLTEFLKDVMMMWLANNKQFLFDDKSKEWQVVKILGKDNVGYYKQMLLDQQDIPDYAMKQIAQTLLDAGSQVSDAQLRSIVADVSVPVHPIIMNPKEKDPAKFEIKSKLSVSDQGDEADLYMTRADMDGEFDYIPDVSSMAAGASLMQKAAREKAMQLAFDPNTVAMLKEQGYKMPIKELLVSTLEDAGFRDAESQFEKYDTTAQPQPTTGAVPPGQGTTGASQPFVGSTNPQGMGAGISNAVTPQF